MVGISVIPIAGMKQRILFTKFRHTISITLFKDTPFLLFCVAEFFGFIGIYIAFFYVQLYALLKCNTSAQNSSLLLAITNAGLFLGRLVPNYLSDNFTGPMNIQIPFAFTAAALALA